MAHRELPKCVSWFSHHPGYCSVSAVSQKLPAVVGQEFKGLVKGLSECMCTFDPADERKS